MSHVTESRHRVTVAVTSREPDENWRQRDSDQTTRSPRFFLFSLCTPSPALARLTHSVNEGSVKTSPALGRLQITLQPSFLYEGSCKMMGYGRGRANAAKRQFVSVDGGDPSLAAFMVAPDSMPPLAGESQQSIVCIDSQGLVSSEPGPGAQRDALAKAEKSITTPSVGARASPRLPSVARARLKNEGSPRGRGERVVWRR
jgi:hypothetical protein